MKHCRQSPNKITASKAGWPSQFRFAVNDFWSGVCEFRRWAAPHALKTQIDFARGRDCALTLLGDLVSHAAIMD